MSDRATLVTADCRLTVPGGPPFTLVIDPDTTDPVGRDCLAGDLPNQYLTDLLRTFTRPGDFVLDLGAHVGSFALAAAALGRRVLAIDANTKHHELLLRSKAANGFADLTVVHAAVGDRAGSVEFIEDGLWGQIAPAAGGPPGRRVVVPLDTGAAVLAAAGWDRVDFLKIDIEGSEAPAFRGLAPVLSRPDGPVIVYESNPWMMRTFGRTVAELRAVLAGFGYASYRMIGDRFVPFDDAEPQVEAWMDAIAMKPPHAAVVAARIDPPLTTDQLAKMAREWYACSPDYQYRVHLAGELAAAPPALRDHPDAVAAMAALAADPHPDVRAAAAWSRAAA